MATSALVLSGLPAFADGHAIPNSGCALAGDGDANEGATPAIFANAYTNAINGATASETFHYALDAETDALVSLANNAGTLATIAPVTVDGGSRRSRCDGRF